MQPISDTYTIMRAGAKSKEKQAANTKLNIGFDQDWHLLDNNQYVGKLDVYQQYLTERDACTTYRLIVTIDPICTNVLFNPCSIITDKDYERIYNTGTGDTPATALIYEPSNEDYQQNPPVTFFCGYDIFDNVQFRTTRFKRSTKLDSLVPLKPDPSKLLEEDEDSAPLVHVYTLDDIVDVHTATQSYLMEYDGWISFKNPSKLKVYKWKFNEETEYKYDKYILGTKWDPNMKDDKIESEKFFLPFANKRRNCDTIDMFPFREMFSFNPIVEYNCDPETFKYESCKILKEENWRYFLTYPWKMDCEHWLVSEGEANGIPIIFGKKLEADDEENTKFNIPVGKFTTAYPHNLKQGDTIFLTSDEKEYQILYVENDRTAYLYIQGQNGTDPAFDNARMRRIVNKMKSEYYVRIFRKLPNWRWEEEDITPDNIEERIEANDKLFTNTKYSLAYATTIFNDRISQICFTDSIDLKLLLDNRCRPVTEIYLTVLKNNEHLVEGSEVQWTPGSWGQYKTKYQRFWSRNSVGFELTDLKDKDLVQPSLKSKGTFETNYPSVSYLHNLQEAPGGEWQEGTTKNYPRIEIIDKEVEPKQYQPGYVKNMEFAASPKSFQSDDNLGDVDKEETMEFYGDIAEWAPGDFKETILCPVCYRFNTTPRESFDWSDKMMVWHQIFQDDEDRGYDKDTGATQLTDEYDPNTEGNCKGPDIKIPEDLNDCKELYELTNTSFVYRGYMNMGPRPEGYYHKAHYPIKLKFYADRIKEKSCKDYKIKIMQPENCTGTPMIAFITYVKHDLMSGDWIRIHFKDREMCDPPCDKVFRITVPAIDRAKFLIAFDEDVMKAGKDGIIVTRYYPEIPTWAQYMDDGSYIWRDILKNDEQNTYSGSEQHEEFPYTNNHFYIHNKFRLYLRRQGNALYYKDYLNDLQPDEWTPGRYEEDPPKDIC
jgi:hypothetical protein